MNIQINDRNEVKEVYMYTRLTGLCSKRSVHAQIVF